MGNADPIRMVRDEDIWHLILQEDDEDFNVSLCGIEVVVEDPDYHFMSDRHELTDRNLCWECCQQFGRIGERSHKKENYT